MNCQILRRLSLRTASINLCSSVIQYAQRIRRLRQAKKISIKRSEQPASAGDFAMEHLRIAALHDISGFGRGSMTTAVSVCAAAGIQCCPLVGAVLSAHTAYPNVTIRDLTEDLPSCVANWQAIGCQFDGFYSGYMSDIRQAEQMLALYETCAKPGSLLVVDPVMGDNGKAYAGAFGPEFAGKMAEYCGRAHVITPNLTEAAMLLGQEPDVWRNNPDFIESCLDRLLQLGCGAVVVTGVRDGAGNIGAVYQTRQGEKGSAFRPQVGAYFPGTGDLFTSVLTTALLRGGLDQLNWAVGVAVDFVQSCILQTHNADTPPLEGVLLEEALPSLWKMLKRKHKK